MVGNRVGFTRAAQRATQASDRLCCGDALGKRPPPTRISFVLSGSVVVPTLLCGGVLF